MKYEEVDPSEQFTTRADISALVADAQANPTKLFQGTHNTSNIVTRLRKAGLWATSRKNEDGTVTVQFRGEAPDGEQAAAPAPKAKRKAKK